MNPDYSIPPKLTPAALSFRNLSLATATHDDDQTLHTAVSPSATETTYERSPIRVDGDQEIGDVCESAMTLLAVLDTEALQALQERMGSRTMTRLELVDEVAACICSSRFACQSSFTTHGDDGMPLRKSDADFRTALKQATSFSIAQLTALVHSIDKHDTNHIRFDDVMTFFVAAGRKVASLTNSPHAHESPTASRTTYGATEITGVPAYHSLVAVEGRGCFLAATLRWVDILDENFKPVAGTKRILTPQGDPHATIACVAYSTVFEEVVVGLNNNKIMSFGFVDGQKQRECAVPSRPCGLLCSPARNATMRGGNLSSAEPELAAAAVHRDELTDYLFCGTETGTLLRAELVGLAQIRVSHASRISSSRISFLTLYPALGCVVCATDDRLVVCSEETTAMKPPFPAGGTITCAMQHSTTGALVYCTAHHPDAMFVFPKRSIKSAILQDPVVIRRTSARNTHPVTTCLVEHPFSPDLVISGSSSATVSVWNVVKKCVVSVDAIAAGSATAADGAASSVGSDEDCIQLSAMRPVIFGATLRSKRSVYVGGKDFTHRVVQSTTNVAVVPEEECDDNDDAFANHIIGLGDGGTSSAASARLLQNVLDVPVVALSLTPKFTAFPSAATSALVVYAQGITVVDMHTQKSVVELSFGTSPTSAHRRKAPLRIRCACFGPGQSLLLGSESGDIHLFSLDPATLGDCDVMGKQAATTEVCDIFFVPTLNIVGYSSFHGVLTTAQLTPGHDGLCLPVTASSVHRCDTLAFDEVDNLLVVVDLEELVVRTFTVVDVGTRLRPLAKVSLFGTPLFELAQDRRSPMSLSFLGKAKSSLGSDAVPAKASASTPTASPASGSLRQLVAKVLIVSTHCQQSQAKQLFQDESQAATIFLAASLQGTSDTCAYCDLRLTLHDGDDDDGDDSFVTSLRKPSCRAGSTHSLVVRGRGTLPTAITAASTTGDFDTILLGLSDGTISLFSLVDGCAAPAVSLSPSKKQGTIPAREPVAALCHLPALGNDVIVRLNERPVLRIGVPVMNRGCWAGHHSTPLSSQFASPAGPSPSLRRATPSPASSSTRKSNSAKPSLSAERASPSWLPKIAVRSGSAGTPSQRSVNSILQVVSDSRRSTPKRGGVAGLLNIRCLPPLYSK